MTRQRQAPARRIPGPVTREYLLRAAIHYLERYASSSGNLARVLERKILRRARERGEEAGTFLPLVPETLARLAELGLLDDAAYAQARVASLRRKGTSRRLLLAKLNEKGVDRELAAEAVAADETDEDVAAFAFARRRRLGPFRSERRPEKRERDVAAMMRAGFAFSLSVRVVDGIGDDPAHG